VILIFRFWLILVFRSHTHQFARNALLACARKCGLGSLPELYLDLALMRIIEPTSKLRSMELLELHFKVTYAKRTLYRLFPELLAHKDAIDAAAIKAAQGELQEQFRLVLYDVTTLYFESFKEYDFQKPGLSKDNKPMQPQIVIGLITTRSGFPVMHEVFEGNTFEGKTMLKVIQRFQERVGVTKPVIVADAGMLSKDNMLKLENEGYRYIVGARVASTAASFIDQVHKTLPRNDKALRRFSYKSVVKNATMICEFSESRYKKDSESLINRSNGRLPCWQKTSPVGAQSLSRKPRTPTSLLFSIPIFRQRQRSFLVSKVMSPTSLRRSCQVVQLSTTIMISGTWSRRSV